jgi:hypothetical protein
VDTEIRFESEFTVNETADALRRALRESPSISERLIPTKTALAGEVTPAKLTLYRDRGGRSWYLRFEGKLISANERSAIVGRMVPNPPVLIGLYVGIMFLISAVAVLFPPFHWKGLESAVVVGIGLGIGALAVFVIRFRRKNVEAETELLREDIRRVVRKMGV